MWIYYDTGPNLTTVDMVLEAVEQTEASYNKNNLWIVGACGGRSRPLVDEINLQA